MLKIFFVCICVCVQRNDERAPRRSDDSLGLTEHLLRCQRFSASFSCGLLTILTVAGMCASI